MLLSIIIPVFNGEKHIGKTLDLLVEQGLESIEVLLVNDGSTDKTAEIINTFVEKNNNILSISLRKNSGVSIARNIGIENAKGQYIYFLDADDSIPSETLSFLKKTVLEHNKTDVFVFGWRVVKTNGKIKEHSYKKCGKNFVITADSYYTLFLNKKIECHNCNIVYLRNFLEKHCIKFTEGATRGEDVEFFNKAFSKANAVYYSSRIIFNYLLNLESTTQAYTVYKLANKESFERNKYNLLEIKKQKPSFSKEINFYIANLYVANLYYYLKSKDVFEEINDMFLKNKTLLFERISFSFPRTVAFWIMRFVPIKLLLKFKRK
jgi:UDP-glucose:(glucosyl)LPS beta-1,3-glucosyltransferase